MNPVKNSVFIGVGSNIDPSENIGKAETALSRFLSDISRASIYVTDPVDYYNQPPFLNTVIKGVTELSPENLLHEMKNLEKMADRSDSSIPKGPRTLDLDLLIYNNTVMSTEYLIVPHASMKNRKFVLIPLLEIEPELSDPCSGLCFSSILNNLSEQGVYRFDLGKYNKVFAGDM